MSNNNDFIRNFDAMMGSATPKSSENKPAVDAEVLANMKTHYSSIMTEGATNFGGDNISKSIFSQIDTDHNKKLSLDEINSANLDEIILNTVETNKYYQVGIKECFGEAYTENASKTDPNSTQSTTEQIVNNNINHAIKQILEYAENHPEDTKVQEYAKKLTELQEQHAILSGDIEHEFAVGEHLPANSLLPNGAILVDNRDQLANLNSRNVLHTILHELGHVISGDDLDSVAEEVMVETNARELAKTISGEDIYKMPIEEFAEQYEDANYPVASPGTYNIPSNAGITTSYIPKEVTMEDDVLIIRSEVDKNGNRIEDRVTYGPKTDADGNTLPTSARRVIINSSEEKIFSTEYGKYDPIRKAFTRSAIVDIKQKMFEDKMNGVQDSSIPFGLS